MSCLPAVPGLRGLRVCGRLIEPRYNQPGFASTFFSCASCYLDAEIRKLGDPVMQCDKITALRRSCLFLGAFSSMIVELRKQPAPGEWCKRERRVSFAFCVGRSSVLTRETESLSVSVIFSGDTTDRVGASRMLCSLHTRRSIMFVSRDQNVSSANKDYVYINMAPSWIPSTS